MDAFEYTAGGPDAAWLTPERKAELKRAVASAAGRDLEIKRSEEGFSVTFVVEAPNESLALGCGEAIMRSVSGGGFWQGTSRALRLD